MDNEMEKIKEAFEESKRLFPDSFVCLSCTIASYYETNPHYYFTVWNKQATYCGVDTLSTTVEEALKIILEKRKEELAKAT